jgi:ankyrin repeat protein
MIRMRMIAALLVLLLTPAAASAQIGIEIMQRRPLAEAARDGNIEGVRQQIAAGTPVNQLDLDFRPAIVVAAANGHADIVKLLAENRANVDGRDRGGRTALMWASERGHVAVVEALIAARANLNLDERGTGSTALMMGAREGHLRVVELQVRAGADLTRTDATGRTVLAVAESANKRPVAEFLRRNKAPP